MASVKSYDILQKQPDCKKLQFQLAIYERCIASQWGPSWSAIGGEPFK